MMDILSDLNTRGLLVQRSHEQAFDDHLVSQSRTVYCGFDPTAPSLHVGNLVPLLALGRFQRAGHKPIILVGGATGLIGDPSGRDEERQLHPTDVVEAWVERLAEQANRFVSFEGSNSARVVNNYDWASRMNLIEFLRDIGKHFSVNALIQREAVKSRLVREGHGISYTEFSYALVQALDFLQLYREYDCTIQLGGQDQWGNIVSGVDLIRRVVGGSAFALTFPLVTRSDGRKFGKSTGDAVWLDPKLTSPYSFYQFWMNADDVDVPRFLNYFTYDSADDIKATVNAHKIDPARRDGQRRLATRVTELVHGRAGLQSAERITEALFGGDIGRLNAADLEQLYLDGITSAPVRKGDFLVDGIVALGMAPSKSRARKLLQASAVVLNGAKVESPDATLTRANALFETYHLVRRGRKTWGLLKHQDAVEK